MDFQNLGSKVSLFKIPLIIFFAGLFVTAVGVGLFVFGQSGGEEVKIVSPGEVVGVSSSKELVLDIGGEVLRPGVYKLADGMRVNDAILAAGGLSADADTTKMNLAAKVADGQKVFVPSKLEQVISEKGEVISQQSSGLVSINNASEAELDKLPGIGPVTAGKLIGARPYSTIEELVSKKAVTKSVFEKIKSMVSL